MNSSPFPLIQRIEQLRKAVEHKEEIRFMEQLNGVTVCSYMVSSASTFDDTYAQECRGITFNSNGEVISRPLHKFFNVNERPSTQFESIDWDKVTRIMEKRDGSMIHTVKWNSWKNVFHATPDLDIVLHIEANFTLKSKKSFTSDVVIAAKKYLLSDYVDKGGWKGEPLIKRYVALGNYLTERDQTGIFEFTSPVARIVIGYKEPSLHLLHVRDNMTGRYLPQAELVELTVKFDVPLVYSVPIIQPVKEQVRLYLKTQTEDSAPDLEGWVIQFENGDMVKLKTKWYMDRHSAFTFLRNRDIARMVLDETLDDLKAKLVGDGIDITPILEIEGKVVACIRLLEIEIEELFLTTVDKDRKTVALEHKGHRLFGLLMQKYSSREPDVKRFFEKNQLDEQFDLTQINLLDTVGEPE